MTELHLEPIRVPALSSIVCDMDSGDYFRVDLSVGLESPYWFCSDSPVIWSAEKDQLYLTIGSKKYRAFVLSKTLQEEMNFLKFTRQSKLEKAILKKF